MKTTSTTVRGWIAGARAGSPDDLGQLMHLCRNYLLVVANRHISGPLLAKADASDLVQETFLEAQEGFATFRGESEDELRLWLRKILKHHLADFRRKYQSSAKRAIDREVPLDTVVDMDTKELALVSRDPTPSQRVIASEKSRMIFHAISKLSPPHQQILVLRHREGRSFQEITKILEKSPAATRKLWARAVVRLHREIRRLQTDSSSQ